MNLRPLNHSFIASTFPLFAARQSKAAHRLKYGVLRRDYSVLSNLGEITVAGNITATILEKRRNTLTFLVSIFDAPPKVLVVGTQYKKLSHSNPKRRKKRLVQLTWQRKAKIPDTLGLRILNTFEPYDQSNRPRLESIAGSLILKVWEKIYNGYY